MNRMLLNLYSLCCWSFIYHNILLHKYNNHFDKLTLAKPTEMRKIDGFFFAMKVLYETNFAFFAKVYLANFFYLWQFTKLYPREICQNYSFAKLYPREIFQDFCFAKVLSLQNFLWLSCFLYGYFNLRKHFSFHLRYQSDFAKYTSFFRRSLLWKK